MDIVAIAQPDSEVPYHSYYAGPVDFLGDGLYVMEPKRFCAPPDPWCDYTGVQFILVRETEAGPWEYVDTWPRRNKGAN